MSGLVSYLSGKAAEEAVMQAYVDQGHRLVARRWRGPAGEIDLILEKDGEIIFVEVKKSRDFARAAESLGPRQIKRLVTSAEHCLGYFPKQSLTPPGLTWPWSMVAVTLR